MILVAREGILRLVDEVRHVEIVNIGMQENGFKWVTDGDSLSI